MRIQLLIALGLAACVSSPQDPAPDAGAAEPAPAPTETPTAYSISPYFYGSAMVVADFDGNGTDDVAIAANSMTVSGHANAGAVYIYKTGAAGLFYSQTLTAADAGLSLASSQGFGSALAARDMDGDGKADLVVGCSVCMVGTKHAGTAFVYHGGTTLTSTGQILSQQMFSGEAVEEGDRFGTEVAIGFFRAGHASIVVGVPDELTVNNTVKTGWVNVFDVGPNLIVTPAQGFDDTVFAPAATDYFGESLAVLDMDDDGLDELVVGGIQSVDIFKGAPLAGWQRIADGHGWGDGFGVGYFHNRTFPSGHRMPELAASTSHDFADHVAVFKSVQSAGNWILSETGELDSPGAHGANGADSFCFGHLLAADFNHDGTDELVVPAIDHDDGLDGHFYVFRSLGGGALTYWGDRAMPSPPACNTSCFYSQAMAIGYFHNRLAVNGGDFDMIVGAPVANLADFYFGDGNGTLPTFDHTMTNP